MLRRLLRIIEGISPTLARVLRESWYTLNGWRFADLKRHQDQLLAHRFISQAAFERSLQALWRDGDQPARFAFISNLPPETTGIAACSYYSWQDSEYPIDLFCPVIDTDWFFANQIRLRQRGVRLLDVQSFLTADTMHRYPAIVIAAGNSDHCAYLHAVLRKAAVLTGDLDRVHFYTHDPVLLNLIERGIGMSEDALAETLARASGRRDLEAGVASMGVSCAHLRLSDAGICGASYFASLGIRRFLVNSAAAADILRTDLGPVQADIRQLFHPVFLPPGVQARPRLPWPGDVPLVVGSFGHAGYDKRTEVLAAAVRVLQARGHRTRLLLAGFGVGDYAARHADVLAGLDVELRDAPTDRQLCDAMQAVDVAVQLRAHNRGESSGIVAQLIALECRTVVSDLGAFREYGGAVHRLAAQASPRELADAILDAVAAPVPAAARHYAAQRTPAAFRSALLAALDLPAATRTPPTLPVPLPTRATVA